MNIIWYIAKRINKGGSSEGKLSKPVINIAVGSIILGMAVMILTIFIVKAFQIEVSERTIAFGAHLQIVKASNNNSNEQDPISANQPQVEALKKDPRIKHVQQFITKYSIIKTKSENEGVLIKGIGKNYDWAFIGKHITDGKVFYPKQDTGMNPILISKTIADRLGLAPLDKITLYFLVPEIRTEVHLNGKDTTVNADDPWLKDILSTPELTPDTSSYLVKDYAKKLFRISGIYETGLNDFDGKMVFTTETALKKIMKLDSTMTGGYELYVNDFDQVDELSDEIYAALDQDLTCNSIKQLNPGIFEWLDMHDTTAWIVLVLMVIVSVINMISALIIIIIEKINMIGILKALGMSNWNLVKVFISQAAVLIGKGMLWGNVLGLLIAFLQWKFHIFKLDQATYYVSYIPISFEWLYILLLNLGTFIICIIFMLLPAIIVARTTPIKAIKFN